MFSTTKTNISIFPILLLVGCAGCGQTSPGDFHYNGPIINGISLVAPVRAIDSASFLPLKKIYANWIALIPYAFGISDSTKLYYNDHYQWWGERTQGIAACTRMAHAFGMHVMLKPQVWYRNGFSGTFHLDNEREWKQWEKNYRNLILHFARLADSLHIEMFCIGTEWDSATREQPLFWRGLIDTIRKIYHGKITYAANWDAYQDFPAWDKLDFIGINAYFPLSNEKTPETRSLVKAWKPVVKKLKQLSGKFKRPILFTEYGYRSTDYTTRSPWESETTYPVNDQAQAHALEALYQTFYRQPWFAGGFLWKWYATTGIYYQRFSEKDYTPQGKPAEKIIAKWYSKSSMSKN